MKIDEIWVDENGNKFKVVKVEEIDKETGGTSIKIIGEKIE